MKRLVVTFCVILAIGSAVLISGFAAYHSIVGDNVDTYFRFFKNEDGEKKFNWYGILFPVQTEYQKLSWDTISFSQKVIYPYAPKFNLTEPDSKFEAEEFIADEMSRVINDSLSRREIKTLLDYDGASLGVRDYANPKINPVTPPTVHLKLYGTASPDARKYGLRESLEPGNIELENVLLAKDRLERTAGFLEQKGFKAVVKDYTEVQLESPEDVSIAMENPAILDSMRYVIADVKIPIEKLEVTTITAPILLPLWFIFSLLGFGWLVNLKFPRRKVPRTKTRIPIKKRIVLILVWIYEIWDYRILWFRRRGYPRFITWWRGRTNCQRVLMFVLPYALLMTLLALYFYFN